MKNLVAPVGVAVKRIRETLGWSQADLAKRSGLHVTAISHIECGRRGARLETLYSVAKAFGMTIQKLLDAAFGEGK